MIANNITKVRSFGETEEKGDAVVYRAICACTDNHHDQTLCLECDETSGILELTINHELWFPDWKEENWFKKIWKRITVSFRLLFTGYVELEGGFMFSGQEAIKDYIDALKLGLKRLKNRTTNGVNSK